MEGELQTRDGGFVVRGREGIFEDVDGDRRWRGGDGVAGAVGSSISSRGMNSLGVLNVGLVGVFGFGRAGCIGAAGCFSGEAFAVGGIVPFLGRPRGFGAGFWIDVPPSIPVGGSFFFGGRLLRLTGLDGFSLVLLVSVGCGKLTFVGKDCKASRVLPSQHFSKSPIIVSLFLTGLNPYDAIAFESLAVV